MSSIRLVLLGAALLLLLVAAGHVPAASASDCDQAAQLANGQACPADLSDYYLRHPSTVNWTSAPDLSDYYLRHPGTVISAAVVDLSDYYLRHPNAAQAMKMPDLP